MSSHQKIVLVNESRLLRGILKRAVERDLKLHVVAEVDNLNKFPRVIKSADADWIILALPPKDPIPKVISEVLRRQPDLNLLVMATDGSRVRVRWIETHETSLEKNNLDEILTILREKNFKQELTARIRR